MAEVYKHVPVTVAKMAGNDGQMDITAHKAVTLARLLATQHIRSGSYYDDLKVKNVPGKKGVRDRLIVAEDKAAISIEWGHFNTWAKRHVKGQFILTKTIAAMPGYKHTYGTGGINGA